MKNWPQESSWPAASGWGHTDRPSLGETPSGPSTSVLLNWLRLTSATKSRPFKDCFPNLLFFSFFKKKKEFFLFLFKKQTFVLYGSISSVQFSHSVMSDSLPPHELQHARPPCPAPTPRVHSDSCPSSQWCHPAISSSVIPFSSYLQTLPVSESFPRSQFCIRWPKYWSFSFIIIPSKENPGLISFRMDWLDLLVVQGTLKSLLQHHSSKASIIQHSAFFTVQLLHPYMTNGKTIDLTRRTFVGKVMSLLLNMLSRLVITFLPRSKRLLISWLQSPSAVIL